MLIGYTLRPPNYSVEGRQPSENEKASDNTAVREIKLLESERKRQYLQLERGVYTRDDECALTVCCGMRGRAPSQAKPKF